MSHILDTFVPTEVELKFSTELLGTPGPSVYGVFRGSFHCGTPILVTSPRGVLFSENLYTSTPMEFLGC